MESNLTTNPIENENFVSLKRTKDVKLSIWVYIIIALRSYFLQSGFNFGNFQGLGYANVIVPGLKKIYGKNTQAFRDAVIENIEFFNSNPQTLPLITSIHIAMLSSGRAVDEARTIKMSLMGPLSGIGDSLSQFAIYPLFAVIAIGFAQNGDVLGPIIFLVGINVTLIILKIVLGVVGFKIGEAAIAKLATQMQSVIRVSGMIGVTVISALALRLTKVNFAISFTQKIDGGATGSSDKVIAVQEILNNIVPYLASGIWIYFIYKMITKFNWNVYRVIIVTLLVGVTLGVFGILGA